VVKLDGRALSGEDGVNANAPTVADGSARGGYGGVATSGVVGQSIRADESATEDGRHGRSNPLGTNESISHRQHSDEGESVNSGDTSLETEFPFTESTLEKLNSINNEQPSIEQIGGLSVYDRTEQDELVAIAAEIADKQCEFSNLIENAQFDESAIISVQLSNLAQKAAILKERINKNEINRADIRALRDIEPKRKSVQNLLEPEVAQTVKFEKLLATELGGLSPYELRKNDSRIEETDTVPIITVERRNTKNIAGDMSTGELKRGRYVNKDTGYTICFGSVGIRDTLNYSFNKGALSALYQAQELIENAVLFETQISDKKNNSKNSLFMHKMYAVFMYCGKPYIADMTVEETFSLSRENELRETNQRLYNLNQIKIAPIKEGKGVEIPDEAFRTFTTALSEDATISIAQLRNIVKRFDKKFYENISAPGRQEREIEINEKVNYETAVEKLNKTRSKRKTDPNQISLFDEGDSAAVTDDQIITTELMRGSGFEDGKYRINEFAKKNPYNLKFAAFLANEYGTGGRSGYGDIVTQQKHDGKGIYLDILDKNAPGGERRIHISYNEAAKRIKELVAKNEYFTEADKQKRIEHAQYMWNEHDHFAPDNATDHSYINRAQEIFAEYEIPIPPIPETPEEFQPEIEEQAAEAETKELRVADNGSPAPIFVTDFKKAQYDIDTKLYKDRDVVAYDSKGVKHEYAKMGDFEYFTSTGAFWGGNEVPGHIYEQIQAYKNGELTEKQVRENYLQYFKDYILVKTEKENNRTRARF
jgi:hypothetical protein